jgi:hypothetical protein
VPGDTGIVHYINIKKNNPFYEIFLHKMKWKDISSVHVKSMEKRKMNPLLPDTPDFFL